jgi:hypothetical protein
MPKAATFTFGKTRVSVEVEGCVSCGTRWSSGWTVVRRLTVRIGAREGEIRLHACVDCLRNKTPLLL